MKARLMQLAGCAVMSLLLSFTCAVQVNAAPVLLYQAGTQAGTFGMGPNETRQTHFQALDDVTLTQLGALVDPTGSQQIQWTIFNSTVGGTFGSQLFTTGTITLTDVGLATYDTTVSVGLVAGSYYILELERLSGAGLTMARFNESNQGLPFTTTDSNLLVIDGGANDNFTNTILPSFSVATVDNSVPAPATLALLGLGLAAVGFTRRRMA